MLESCLGRRLEVAQNNQTIDATRLARRAGDFDVSMEMDETKGHEAIRGVREDDDSFDPEFGVDTPEMDAWIEQVTEAEEGDEE